MSDFAQMRQLWTNPGATKAQVDEIARGILALATSPITPQEYAEQWDKLFADDPDLYDYIMYGECDGLEEED